MLQQLFLCVVFIHKAQLECADAINSRHQGKGQGSQDHHGCGVRCGWHPTVPGEPVAVWDCGASVDISQSIALGA